MYCNISHASCKLYLSYSSAEYVHFQLLCYIAYVHRVFSSIRPETNQDATIGKRSHVCIKRVRKANIISPVQRTFFVKYVFIFIAEENRTGNIWRGKRCSNKTRAKFFIDLHYIKQLRFLDFVKMLLLTVLANGNTNRLSIRYFI